MSLSGPQVPAHLVPLMRYRDVGIASEWLCAAFGFEANFAAKAPDGAVFYAELRLGDSMIMLGAAGEPSPSDVMSDVMSDVVGDAGVANDPGQAQSCYVVLQDVDAHYAQAKRGGATITLDIKSDDIGGRGYSCRDLEGHIWNFGTYDPWKGQSKAPRSNRAQSAKGSPPGLRAAMTLTLAVSVLSGWYVYGQIRGPGDGLTLERLRQALLGPRSPDGSLSTGGIARPDGTTDSQSAAAAVSRAQRTVAAMKEELERERRAKAEALDAATKAEAESSRAETDAAKAKLQAETAQASVARVEAEAAKTQADAARIATTQNAQIEATRRDAERAQAALAEAAAKVATAELQAKAARQPDASGRVPPAAILAELAELKAAREVAVKSVAEMQTALATERETKDSALRALADAGARIAALEVELKATQNEATRLRRQRAATAARQRVQPKKQAGKSGNQPFPYSEW